MAEFLSEAWFARARELVDSCQGPADLHFRLQFDANGRRWHQVVEGGATTAWAIGEIDHADLEVHLPLAVAKRVHTGAIDGTGALAACLVARSGEAPGPPSPMDIEHRPELDALMEMPGADLRTQYHFADGPFGPVDFWWQFADGRSEAMGWGEIDEPDVSVSITFANMAAVRNGTMSIYESLEGGSVDGAVGPLMMLAGLQESPELHAAELACGPAGEILAALGRFGASAGYREALAQLAKETS